MFRLDRLRSLKEQSGLTLQEIAERSQLNRSSLQKVFAGTTEDARFVTLVRLCQCFNCKVDDIWEDPEYTTSVKP